MNTHNTCPICRRELPPVQKRYLFRGLKLCSLMCRILITSPRVQVKLPELEEVTT